MREKIASIMFSQWLCEGYDCQYKWNTLPERSREYWRSKAEPILSFLTEFLPLRAGGKPLEIEEYPAVIKGMYGCINGDIADFCDCFTCERYIKAITYQGHKLEVVE